MICITLLAVMLLYGNYGKSKAENQSKLICVRFWITAHLGLEVEMIQAALV